MGIKEIIKNKVWQFSFIIFGSCVYLVKLKEKNILIDTSSKFNKYRLVKYISELNLGVEEIDILILTHNHFDHTGNTSLFKKAKVYSDKKDFPQKDVLDIKELKIPEFERIDTPGHTKGSFCLFLKKEKVLFSGDTLFHNGIGRTDLPGSEPEKMETSLKKLEKLKYKYLCPGHID